MAAWALRCEASCLLEGKSPPIVPPQAGNIFLFCQEPQEHVDMDFFNASVDLDLNSSGVKEHERMFFNTLHTD